MDYEGNLAVSTDLLEAAGMSPGERVLVGLVPTGARLETCLVAAPAGHGAFVRCGAAAHPVSFELAERLSVDWRLVHR